MKVFILIGFLMGTTLSFAQENKVFDAREFQTFEQEYLETLQETLRSKDLTKTQKRAIADQLLAIIAEAKNSMANASEMIIDGGEKKHVIAASAGEVLFLSSIGFGKFMSQIPTPHRSGKEIIQAYQNASQVHANMGKTLESLRSVIKVVEDKVTTNESISLMHRNYQDHMVEIITKAKEQRGLNEDLARHFQGLIDSGVKIEVDQSTWNKIEASFRSEAAETLALATRAEQMLRLKHMGRAALWGTGIIAAVALPVVSVALLYYGFKDHTETVSLIIDMERRQEMEQVLNQIEAQILKMRGEI